MRSIQFSVKSPDFFDNTVLEFIHSLDRFVIVILQDIIKLAHIHSVLLASLYLVLIAGDWGRKTQTVAEMEGWARDAPRLTFFVLIGSERALIAFGSVLILNKSGVRTSGALDRGYSIGTIVAIRAEVTEGLALLVLVSTSRAGCAM